MHGFIFVVDSTDPDRLNEAKDALREFLRNEKVRGKPVLLLCNKTDVETAEEMDVVVDALNVERLVNEAREEIQKRKCWASMKKFHTG